MSISGLRLSLRTLLLLMLLQLVQSSAGDGGVKRAPQGFLGMRGKKYIDYEDAGPYDDRRSQGFVGVKGKKDLPYYPYDLFYKRAPMGFVGMRGKKEYDLGSAEYPEYAMKRGSILGQIDYSSDENALERDQFSLLSDLIQQYILENDASKEAKFNNSIDDIDMGSSELTKRAAHGFFGVRGKKSAPSYRGNKRPFDLSFRGKFVGVRGKKSVEATGADGEMSKRKGPGVGFFGVRGKKWIDSGFPSDEAEQN